MVDRECRDSVVSDPSSRAFDAKPLVLSRLGELEDALDGFPAELLLNDFLARDAVSKLDDCRARTLCEYVLARWVAEIECDLERFPPATMDVLEEIRQRMARARDALQILRSLLQESKSLAPPGVQAP